MNKVNPLPRGLRYGVEARAIHLRREIMEKVHEIDSLLQELAEESPQPFEFGMTTKGDRPTIVTARVAEQPRLEELG